MLNTFNTRNKSGISAHHVLFSTYNHLNGNQSAWRIFNNHLCNYTKKFLLSFALEPYYEILVHIVSGKIMSTVFTININYGIYSDL